MSSVSSKKKIASVEWDSSRSPPVLTAGEITPQNARDYELACDGYFERKKIAADEQVAMILYGFKDACVISWVSAHRDRLKKMDFPAFMSEFRKGFLGNQWEQIVRRELNAMRQGSMSFWAFAQEVQAKNSLLIGTSVHLDDDGVISQLEAGMDERLALRVYRETFAKTDLLAWLNEVKRVDEILDADRREFRNIASQNQSQSTRATSFNSNPSRNANTSSTNKDSDTRTPYLPKLMETEKELLSKCGGCFKCRRPHADHMSRDCQNGFPSKHIVITQEYCDSCKSSGSRHRSSNKTVAAVSGSSRRQSYRGRSPSRERCSTTARRSASPKRSRSPAYRRPRTRSRSRTVSVSPQRHPVAAVMGRSDGPTAYMPSNDVDVLSEGSGSSNEEREKVLRERVRARTVVSSSVSPLVASVERAWGAVEREDAGLTAPFFESHMFWKCCVVGAEVNETGASPFVLRSLIDHGSHAVLIQEDLVDTLGLRRRALPKPETVSMAMGDGGERSYTLTEWVKIQLYDPTSGWTSSSVRAVIAPNLCSPIILGLPFLSHNKIVVDAELRTVIQKDTNIDLLHPMTPDAREQRRSPHEIRKEIRQDKRAVIKQLKSVNQHLRRVADRQSEKIKPFDVVGAVRTRIEVLAAEAALAA